MPDLDPFYTRLLIVGFILMKQAVESGDREWLDAEFELLHNVPSLIGEANPERHKYFWFKERPHYVQWASSARHGFARSRMLTYYQPICQEMDAVAARLFSQQKTA